MVINYLPLANQMNFITLYTLLQGSVINSHCLHINIYMLYVMYCNLTDNVVFINSVCWNHNPKSKYRIMLNVYVFGVCSHIFSSVQLMRKQITFEWHFFPGDLIRLFIKTKI